MDKASPHYKARKVIHYFEENKDTLIPVYTFQLPHHQRVYDDGGGLEYGQTGSACSKILFFICRF